MGNFQYYYGYDSMYSLQEQYIYSLIKCCFKNTLFNTPSICMFPYFSGILLTMFFVNCHSALFTTCSHMLFVIFLLILLCMLLNVRKFICQHVFSEGCITSQCFLVLADTHNLMGDYGCMRDICVMIDLHRSGNMFLDCVLIGS